MAFIIGIGNSKGGVGKSSLTHLFSITISNQPIAKKVLVIDATPNRHLSFLSQVKSNEWYSVVSCQPENIPTHLNKYADQVDIIFIDFPQEINLPGVKTGMLCCDTFLIPTRTSLPDQIATKLYLETIEEISKIRIAKGYPFYYFLIPSLYIDQDDIYPLHEAWEKNKIPFLKYGLPLNKQLALMCEDFEPIMDYVTDGIAWKDYQTHFHNGFIELYNFLETKFESHEQSI